MLDVTVLIHGDFDLDLVVGGMRVVAPQVMVEAGGAAGDAHHAEVAGDCGREDAGMLEAIAAWRRNFR